MRPYILAETNWKEVKDTTYEAAILPWGACEAHNYHLPYGTDIIEADGFAAEAARRAWDRGAQVIVLPTIPFGVNTGQADIKLDMNMNPSTQQAVLRDVVDVVNRAGIRKLIILNSHGGNDFKNMIRELGLQFPDMFLCSCLWFKAIDQTQYFDHLEDHGGEMETSIVMHLTPHLVRPLQEAGDGATRKFKIQAMQEGWAWAERKWSQVTKDTGAGDPRQASVQKGQACFNAVSEKLAHFFCEVAKADVDDLYTT